nr:hypothetical protein [Tanacetum cinerariifolium]
RRITFRGSKLIRGWPMEAACDQSMSVLLHPGHSQSNTRLSSVPLCLSSAQLGRGSSIMVRPRRKSLSYPLYVIKSPQSSIVTVCGVVLRARWICLPLSITRIPLRCERGTRGGDDVAVSDQIQEGDHVIQDEGADLVRIEDEVPTTAAEKPKV